MMLELTDANYQRILSGTTPIVIDFWAVWCGPCRVIAPIMEELATEYEEKVLICKCNVDTNNTLATNYGIRSIPTLLFIKDGKVVDKQIGVTDKAALKTKIKTLI
jgi:thioredoxin 1